MVIWKHGRVRYCRDFGMGIGLLCGDVGFEFE
jgi:hypothetical protein